MVEPAVENQQISLFDEALCESKVKSYQDLNNENVVENLFAEYQKAFVKKAVPKKSESDSGQMSIFDYFANDDGKETSDGTASDHKMTQTSIGTDAVDASFAVHQVDTSLQIDLQKSSGSKNVLPYAKQEFIKKVEELKKVAISVPKIGISYSSTIIFKPFTVKRNIMDFDVAASRIERYDAVNGRLLQVLDADALIVENPENMLAVSLLESIPEFSSDDAEFILDVVDQYLTLIEGTDEEKKKIVRRYATVIVEDLRKQIYASKEESTEFVFNVQKDLIVFKSFAKNMKENGRLNFKKEVPDKKNIKKYLFEGYKKSYYAENAFDSDDERRLSVVLEEDSEVIRFIKPPLNQLGLFYNGNIYIYVMKMQLDNGYKMVSVYLHNNDKSDGDEKEYEKVMFQVEMLIADDLMSPIFVPEYLCRKVELEDEYYYKGRPVYARGRGCAATWEKKAEEVNATAIKSSFIPDYENPSVSAQIDDMPEHAFSMLQMGSSKKKSEVIQNLRTLTEMYGSWITDVLTNDEAMQDDIFKATGQVIIDKCNDANRRMNVGIDLIENNDKVYQAFVFMNQAMYLQRSITAFSKDYGNGIPCSLRDYMTDMPEKGRKKDHSEWRPFQIAFVLLNLYGIMDGESPERNIVDLLYFPTGGGKTEAYLGLIAFTIAYRRLTALDETDYEKDGGVTVFLRYTLRLLTTQQRDRLMRLIVAMERLREESQELYGKERISIGFWVGGNVTPNKFSEYSNSDQFKKKEFIRKLTKQIIKCPYCGKEITRDEYDINEKGKYVKIHCADKNCMFSLKTGRTIPVYLVDEEIYAKCPTVIISTVDKFARLPWSERVGLLFGRTDRYCSKEMSMQSGYSSSALHERIYSSENMCGILIYTGAADKEGSLGGLVELGGMNKFLPLLKGALENGLTCTTDPECFMKNPTSERLNGAACHSCTMISETACENGNRLLDRALVVPVPEHAEMGYFRELVRDLCGIQV